MDINEKYLKEHIKAYCKRCGILNGSKEAFHYEMGLRHGLEENTSKLHQPTVSDLVCDNCGNDFFVTTIGGNKKCHRCGKAIKHT